MLTRLGLDVGHSSIGWALLRLNDAGEPDGIVDLGVRLFDSGRHATKGTSLAVDRRMARQMRRRRDRFLLRRAELLRALVEFGLMPADPVARKALELLDPYELRARGLTEALTPHEFGRALFHLHQRRGFKSGRKGGLAEGDDAESGKIEDGARKLEGLLAEHGYRTLGAFLAARQRENSGKHLGQLPVRVRLQGEERNAAYDFYPQRAMVEREFGLLWDAQSALVPSLPEAGREALRCIMFRQRPLRPVEPGRCSLLPDERRAPWAHPLAQRFRMLKELNNLRLRRQGTWEERPISRAERDALLALLERKPHLTFDQMRKALKLDSTWLFNLEANKRDRLKGDETAVRLADKGPFGKAWWTLSQDQRAEVVGKLLVATSDDEVARLARDAWGLDEERARSLARLKLPDGHCAFSLMALSSIVPILETGTDAHDKKTGELRLPGEHEAIERAGYKPRSLSDGSQPLLPPYQDVLRHHLPGGKLGDDPSLPENVRAERLYGRYQNPTIHIGLIQLRKLVNAIIKRHGKPDEIVIEFVRDLKMTADQKAELSKRQRTEEALNKEADDFAARHGSPLRTGEARRRYRLWTELGESDAQRLCPYTGQVISGAMLLSDQVAIDHILPFAETLDDSMANKVLCLKRANDAKGKKSPAEAFKDRDGWDWDAILLRAERLPPNKRWRFRPDAMDRFRQDGGFVDRALTDTSFLARVAREYVSQVCPPNKVRVSPGRLTALLRGKWGLNQLLGDANLKNRTDHRHHTIDAFVVAMTDQGLIHDVAKAAAKSREDRLIEDMPEPKWLNFREDLRDRLNAVIVSLRPDHGRQGRLHEDTAYGVVEGDDRAEGDIVVRKPLLTLAEPMIARIRDRRRKDGDPPGLRERLLEHVAAERAAGRDLKAALASFAQATGVRRVRLLKREESVIPIRHNGHLKAVVPGENWAMDIFEQPDGRWVGAGITRFEAAAGLPLDERRKGHPAARRIMRVHKGDYVALDEGGPRDIYQVVQLEVSQQRFRLAPHNEGGELQKRHDDKADSFRWLLTNVNGLRQRRLRKVKVDAMGRVIDPFRPG